MRADRLIAILLLLQRRGTVTAREVAESLEVSERTARRDLEALAMSGVPVYSRHGRGGGWSLVGGATTDLTGLAADEAQALFRALGPALEKNPELRSALDKLTGALPKTFRIHARRASEVIKVDASAWGQGAPRAAPEHLDALTDAAVLGRQVRVDYDSARGSKGLRVLHPFGIVAKRNLWYLVAAPDAPGLDVSARSYRVDRVRSLEMLDAPVERPDSFDLDATWERIRANVESLRVNCTVRLDVDPFVIGPLYWLFGGEHVHVQTPALQPQPQSRPSPHPHRQPRVQGVPGVFPNPGLAVSPSAELKRETETVEVVVEARSSGELAAQIAGFGRQIRILEAPPEVFDELRRITTELGSVYG